MYLFIVYNLLYVVQSGFDAVATEVGVGEGRADAVFRKAVGLDPQFAQQAEDRRGHATVALQLDDDHIVHRAHFVGHDVVEAEVEVDREALGLALVHEGDAVEAVFELLAQRRRVVVQTAAQEVVVGDEFLALATEPDVVLRMQGVEGADADALLLRAAAVVLRLHLQEVQPGVHVTADAELLTVGVARFVLLVHRAVVGVEVNCVIRCDALAVDDLGVVVVLRHREQPPQHGDRGDELRVGAVQQVDVVHLFQRDRGEM